MTYKLSTAVALIIFKRASQTERVFRAIAEAQPSRLYIIADGPRNSKEALLCEQTRQIVKRIDWDCEVQKDFSEVNLGLRNRIISGLDWVFEREERAIILEDDCLPHSTFFHFCDELLEYYKHDAQVMHISGDNFLPKKQTFVESYYYSKYAHVWGWATWRRKWSLFHKWDDNPRGLSLDMSIFEMQSERRFWHKLLDQFYSHQMEYTWDYQWTLACMAHKGLCVMPKLNLVANIGFGRDATHTRENLWYANLPINSIEFPLIHPARREWDREADRSTASSFFTIGSPSLLNLMRKAVWRFFDLAQKKYHEM